MNKMYAKILKWPFSGVSDLVLEFFNTKSYTKISGDFRNFVMAQILY